ncbi:MAG TPA: GNAT family N-acetyltransferase [Leeuwenhoekiella sp.]|nr:GNAT family N-acetyltransferase [Leeuwenhoekiella sp.]
MSTYSIKHYQQEDKTVWDNFIAASKNKTFLFYRDFMEYHADRFTDYSLLIYKKDQLVAVIPAHAEGKKLFSHQGLTYGGFILSRKIKFSEVFEVFKQLLVFLENDGFEILEIKNIPSFYNTLPAEELDYLCFLLKAEISRVDIAAVIDMKNRLPIQKNRLEGVKKAEKQQLKIEETTDFSAFWNDILIPNLARSHDAAPVHSLGEIKLLNQLFPQNIRQFNVIDARRKIVGGATIFDTEQVAHVQYISGDEYKQQLGSLDFLFHYLITDVFKDKRYMDFGTSNENAGKNLNAGLQYWKECFGARTFVHRSFRIKIKNHHNLNAVLL